MAEKTETNTPGYIQALLQPRPERAADRKSWSIPVFGVWLPFFTATNVAGETHISQETLGAPVRLAREKDGTARIGENGRPVLRLVKELSDQVRMVRENFQAGLVAYAEGVARAMPDAYKAQVDAARKKGEVINKLEMKLLTDTLDARAAKPADTETGEGEPTDGKPAEPVLVTA